MLFPGIPHKVLILPTVLLLFFLALPCPAKAGNGVIDLRFTNNTLSGHIVKASMKAVLDRIASQRKIWIKGTDRIGDREVSVRFESLSLQKALRRILSQVNHCVVMGSGKKVRGVILLSEKKARPSTVRRSPSRRRY